MMCLLFNPAPHVPEPHPSGAVGGWPNPDLDEVLPDDALAPHELVLLGEDVGLPDLQDLLGQPDGQVRGQQLLPDHCHGQPGLTFLFIGGLKSSGVLQKKYFYAIFNAK